MKFRHLLRMYTDRWRERCLEARGRCERLERRIRELEAENERQRRALEQIAAEASRWEEQP